MLYQTGGWFGALLSLAAMILVSQCTLGGFLQGYGWYRSLTTRHMARQERPWVKVDEPVECKLDHRSFATASEQQAPEIWDHFLFVSHHISGLVFSYSTLLIEGSSIQKVWLYYRHAYNLRYVQILHPGDLQRWGTQSMSVSFQTGHLVKVDPAGLASCEVSSVAHGYWSPSYEQPFGDIERLDLKSRGQCVLKLPRADTRVLSAGSLPVVYDESCSASCSNDSGPTDVQHIRLVSDFLACQSLSFCR